MMGNRPYSHIGHSSIGLSLIQYFFKSSTLWNTGDSVEKKVKILVNGALHPF